MTQVFEKGKRDPNGFSPDVESSGRSAQTRARVFAAISGAALVGGGVLQFLCEYRP